MKNLLNKLVEQKLMAQAVIDDHYYEVKTLIECKTTHPEQLEPLVVSILQAIEWLGEGFSRDAINLGGRLGMSIFEMRRGYHHRRHDVAKAHAYLMEKKIVPSSKEESLKHFLEVVFAGQYY